MKFTKLVENAEKLIAFLPWGKDFEKDKFQRPDFTTLDVIIYIKVNIYFIYNFNQVITFSGPKIWAGQCLPNYDSVR